MKKTTKQIKTLWLVFGLVLVASLLAQPLMHPHAVFGPEAWPLFNAVFGFGSCVLIVLVSKFLGFFLKRREGYYKEARHDDD